MKQENKKNQSGDAVIGIYQATSRGFGFLTPEDGKSRTDDYFIPPRSEGGAWNGDKVQVRPDNGPTRPGFSAVAGGDRKTAVVTAIVERANKTVTGGIRKHNREIWLQPDSDKLPGPIQLVGKTHGVRAGEKAAITMTNYGGGKIPPTGTLKEVFGLDGSREASTAAILYGYEIDREFPDAVKAAALEAPETVEPAALEGRTDLRDARIITIDGASAKDLDDAVSLEKDKEGRWVLGVHIADVSHYVQSGTPLDLEAWERGTSVYFADQVVPMLPKELSNGICSLNPQVDRLAISCIMTMATDGAVLDHKIAKSVIRTTERMNYDDCNTLLEGTDPDLAVRYKEIFPMLRDMAALASALEKRRRLRGSLDLDTSESDILCDEEGKPVDIQSRTQGISQALIESFMLAANECVAEHLCALAKPAVYRVHEKPSMDKTEGLRAMLAPLGYDLTEADNFSLQKVLDAMKDKPAATMVSSIVLRSLMKARYDVENLGHFGLAAKFYCHFTSPIRRYPDLMVHRILTSLLDGTLEGKTEQKLAGLAQKAAVQSSEREIAAQSAEREIVKLYMAEFMQGHLEEELPATVSGVAKFGLFVVLQNGVEGLIPTEALPDDRYNYDELRMTLTGEHTGKLFSFGMPLTVLCVAADAGSGQVDFRIAGEGASLDVPLLREKIERPFPNTGHGGKRGMHAPKSSRGHKKR